MMRALVVVLGLLLVGCASLPKDDPRILAFKPHLRDGLTRVYGTRWLGAASGLESVCSGAVCLTIARAGGKRSRAQRPHRRSQKPPTKASLYHEPLLRSQIILSSSWV